MHSKVWDEIIYASPNFNGSNDQVLEWIRNLIPLLIMDVIPYPYWD